MKWHSIFAIVSIVSILFVAGCSDDNPVNNNEESAHAEAAGLVITMDGTEIVRYEEGAVTGNIPVHAGESTSVLSVQFISEEDGDLFTPGTDHHSLVCEVDDESIATYEKQEGSNWSFFIHGVTAGSTTIEIKIFHGDHADFVSLPISIEVTQ